MVVGIVVVIVVLLSILVWMNLLWLRPKSGDKKATDPSSEKKEKAAEAKRGKRALSNDTAAKAPVETPSVSPDVVAATLDDGARGPAHAVEVVSQDTKKQASVFDRPVHPFRLLEHQVPAFAEDRWQKVFLQLTEDDLVLGWIAFSGESVGASDREYDQPFIEVLRTYRRTVEKLRREVGMASIHETSIVGDEGQVWMITAVDDAWLALFMDRKTDAASVTSRMLEAVRQTMRPEEES